MSAAANNHAQAENTDTVKLQNIQPSLCLNGKKLPQIVSLCPNLSKREGQIESSYWERCPKIHRQYLGAWDEADEVVMSWLWNSMVPKVSDACMFMKTAKDVWESCKETGDQVLLISKASNSSFIAARHLGSCNASLTD